MSRLLEDELLYEEAEVMQRLKHWGKGRLQEEVHMPHIHKMCTHDIMPPSLTVGHDIQDGVSIGHRRGVHDAKQ